MKLTDLSEHLQGLFASAFDAEDAVWQACAHWWEPADRKGPAVEAMRRWHGLYTQFKAAVIAGSCILEAFNAWAGPGGGEDDLPCGLPKNAFTWKTLNIPQSKFQALCLKALSEEENTAPVESVS